MTQTIHKIFEENVRAFPHATALAFKDQQWTYQKLNQKANQLAHFLKRLSLRDEAPIGVALPVGIDLIITLLAILKSGAAYLPIDPRTPAEQVSFILQDCAAEALVTQRSSYSQWELQNSPRNLFFWEHLELAAEAVENLDLADNPNQLAYICYTSGSTGAPKGVMIEHKGVVRLVKATDYIDIQPCDRIAQIANISFDISAFEIWGALLNGAELVCVEPNILLNPSDCQTFYLNERISITNVPARLFDQWVQVVPALFSKLKYLLIGGEPLNPQMVALVMNGAQDRPAHIINAYGPTENAVFTTTYPIPNDFDPQKPIPIGKPIANTSVYVFNEDLQKVPVGVQGELYVGGDGLARGYIQRADLNNTVFIMNPFNPQERLYRTGDMVYWREDGNLEYVGRRDSQVKIRGFRIELGAIENVLLLHPEIAQALVLAIGAEYEKNLCAYLVSRNNIKVLDRMATKQWLSQKLPPYAVPEQYIFLEKIPLINNGKADRKKLLSMAEQSFLLSKQDLPQNRTEEKLAAIWQNLFPGQKIGRNDDFFSLGGYSLLLLQLQYKIEKTFHISLTYDDLLTNGTIAKQAELIGSKAPSDTKSSIVLLRKVADLSPLFLLPPVSGIASCFVLLAKHLQSRSIYGLQDPSLFQGKILFRSLEEMAEYFLKIISQIQPHGPYILAGYSFGAHLAIEIATQLKAKNEAIDFLGLIDGWAKFPAGYSLHKRFQNQEHLLQSKSCPILPVKAVLFKAENEKEFAAIADGFNHWRSYAPLGIERVLVPGNHETMLMEPNVRKLASILQEKLNEKNFLDKSNQTRNLIL